MSKPIKRRIIAFWKIEINKWTQWSGFRKKEAKYYKGFVFSSIWKSFWFQTWFLKWNVGWKLKIKGKICSWSKLNLYLLTNNQKNKNKQNIFNIFIAINKSCLQGDILYHPWYQSPTIYWYPLGKICTP